MTLVRLEAIHDAWDVTPRADSFIAAYFGHKPSREKNKKTETKDIGDLMSMLGLKPGQTVSG